MGAAESVLHFFTPRHTNNYKARALHVSTLSFYIAVFLVFQLGLTFLAHTFPGVLGYATNVTTADLLKLTNEKRVAAGEEPLQINEALSQAAKKKAEDMFTNQYWAHTAPNGRDPWYFILDQGYSYLYAGENLARDFADSQSVVNAWFASPTHKDNLLNSRYQEVGFAIVNGKYQNYETTLVVQMFGTRQNLGAAVNAPARPQPEEKALVSVPAVVPTGEVKSGSIDVFLLTKRLSLALVVLLMVVLGVDAFLVYQRKAVRISGHNLAHMFLLVMLLLALNLVGRGIIL